LDRLASQGVLFEHAYCQSPLCVPSRQSLITGRYPCETGVIHNDMPMPALHTIAHVLRGEGYDTAAIGKMHFIPDSECSLGKERHHGFDRRLDYEEFYWYLRRECGVPALPDQPDDPWCIVHLERWQHALQACRVESSSPMRGRWHNTGTLEFDDHQEALVLREWREYLKERHSRPFLAFVSFQSPHPPFLPTQEILETYEDASLELPEGPEEALLDHPFLAARRASDEEREHYIRHYSAFVTLTDHCIGQALKSLREAGYDENTIIIYVSDHGDMLYDHGLTGKCVFYENSVRAPLIVAWPGHIASGWRYNGLVELIDVFPTLCEAADARLPNDRLGRSLLPDLMSRVDRGSEAVFSETYPMERNRARFGVWPHRMVRTDEWKLIQYGPDYEDLFHLTADPGERMNLSTDASYGDVVKHLVQMLVDRLGELPQPEERLVNGYYERLLRQRSQA